MKENIVKAKLLQGQPVLGAFVNIPSPVAVEVLGILGLDFAILDAEHTSMSPETVEHLCRAAESSGVVPISRIGLNTQQEILKHLDAGSQGIQIPLVNTKEEAQQVVLSAKYPPMGRRGLAGVRAAGYGLSHSLGDHVAMSNKETLVVVQAETKQGAENLDDILSVDGIDVVFMGPTDISSALGLPGQTRHPDVLAFVDALGQKVRRAGKIAGTLAPEAEDYLYWLDRGFLYLCASATRLLADGVKAYLQKVAK